MSKKAFSPLHSPRARRLAALVLTSALLAVSACGDASSASPDAAPSPSDTQTGGDAALVDRAEYGEVAHQAFILGDGDRHAAHPSDIQQGAIDDGPLLAAMAAVAQQQPSLFEAAISVNPNGSYTVMLHEDGRAAPTTVTPDVPLVDGEPVFARFPEEGGDTDGDDHELWPLLIEKAYAQLEGDYGDLEDVAAAEALETLTGAPVTSFEPGELGAAELADLHEAGRPVTLTSTDGRAFYLEGVRVDDETVIVRTPEGYIVGARPYALAEFREEFERVDIGKVG